MTEELTDLRAALDEEGDIAADYLEELLDIADVDGDIEIAIEADRAAVGIVSDDGGDRRLKRLIGKHGETLDAVQELTRLAVQQQTGERSRLMLDILGYRDQHRKEIAAIARDAIERVEESGEAVALKPMNPFERKVVHDVVADAGLLSDSSGIGAARHVVISLPDDDEEIEDDE
ncbi:protein jag [Arcanobacterium phocae]|uniref:Jag family protein n=1 Tax=Arcanobacterium phocae TaxID=131112 RepID=UPI001C0EE408|nr:R3H domain-containing nucleic acid-binding protein [Arcanobacterium phocae]